jgi:2-polyprenyl-3-methyl-5-hydroxy-6-metoxy-1,4-benzoquinol methylase
VTAEPAAAAAWLETNRAWWDERVPLHAAGRAYGLPGFPEGHETLLPYEPDEVGDVQNRTLFHLMCHIGLDTLSWARRGTQVTGLDFAPSALEIVADTATKTGVDAEFAIAEACRTAETFAPRTFDSVSWCLILSGGPAG